MAVPIAGGVPHLLRVVGLNGPAAMMVSRCGNVLHSNDQRPWVKNGVGDRGVGVLLRENATRGSPARRPGSAPVGLGGRDGRAKTSWWVVTQAR